MSLGSPQPTSGATKTRITSARITAAKRTLHSCCFCTKDSSWGAGVGVAWLDFPMRSLAAVDFVAHVCGQHLRVRQRLQEVDKVPALGAVEVIGRGRHHRRGNAGVPPPVEVNRPAAAAI